MLLSQAALVLSAHLVLAADEVPRLNYEATCRALLPSGEQGKGLDQDCLNSQRRARSQVEQQWGQVSGAPRAHAPPTSPTISRGGVRCPRMRCATSVAQSVSPAHTSRNR